MSFSADFLRSVAPRSSVKGDAAAVIVDAAALWEVPEGWTGPIQVFGAPLSTCRIIRRHPSVEAIELWSTVRPVGAPPTRYTVATIAAGQWIDVAVDGSPLVFVTGRGNL